MRRDDQQSILPDKDIVLPGPGGSNKPASQRDRGHRPRRHWLIVLLMLTVGLVWKLTKPVMVTTLIATAVSWLFFPAVFAAITGVLWNADAMLDMDGWLQQVKAMGDKLVAPDAGVMPAEASEALPEEIKKLKQELAADGQIPSVMLSPAPQQ